MHGPHLAPHLRQWAVLVAFLWCTHPVIGADDGGSVLGGVQCRSAVLLEASTGTVLYAHNPNLPHPPASLTKLMTLHVGLSLLDDGVSAAGLQADVPPEAYAANQEPRSSTMGLAPGQSVSVRDLLLGVAVASGNDAAVALARQFAPSTGVFLQMMNRAALDLGYSTLYFADVSGLSEESRITAGDFAKFCSDYIRLHPEALEDLHAVKQFAFPREGPRAWVHTNRNQLLWSYPGADGLKTGYIDESGYNFAATARKGDMRLIAVVLGVEAQSPAEGNRLRADAAAGLLNYGFGTFATVSPRLPALEEVRVWQGKDRTVKVAVREVPLVTLGRDELGTLQADVRQVHEVTAPVRRGDTLGHVVVYAGGSEEARREIGRFALVAESDVERGWFGRRWWDSLRRGVTRIFGGRREE